MIYAELTTTERWLVVDSLRRQAKQHGRLAEAVLDMGERVHEEQQRDACMNLAVKLEDLPVRR